MKTDVFIVTSSDPITNTTCVEGFSYDERLAILYASKLISKTKIDHVHADSYQELIQDVDDEYGINISIDEPFEIRSFCTDDNSEEVIETYEEIVETLAEYDIIFEAFKRGYSSMLTVLALVPYIKDSNILKTCIKLINDTYLFPFIYWLKNSSTTIEECPVDPIRALLDYVEPRDRDD